MSLWPQTGHCELTKKTTYGKEIFLRLMIWEGKVHRSRKGMVMGTSDGWVSYSLLTFHQQRLRDACALLNFFILHSLGSYPINDPTDSELDLSCSVKPLWKCHHRLSQRYDSQVISNCAILTVKIKYQKFILAIWHLITSLLNYNISLIVLKGKIYLIFKSPQILNL